MIIGAPIGVLLYFFYPILIPLWRALPLWLRATILGIGALFIAVMGGRHIGRENAREEERRRNAEALRKRAEVDNEISGMSNDQIQKKLRDRWGVDDSS
jgi:hypothetical protein